MGGCLASCLRDDDLDSCASSSASSCASTSDCCSSSDDDDDDASLLSLCDLRLRDCSDVAAAVADVDMHCCTAPNCLSCAFCVAMIVSSVACSDDRYIHGIVTDQPHADDLCSILAIALWGSSSL